MSKLFSLQLELSYEIPFIGKVNTTLDDLELEFCAEGEVPKDSDQLSCDFDKENTCSWYHDYTTSLLWTHHEKDSGGAFPLLHFHFILLLKT